MKILFEHINRIWYFKGIHNSRKTEMWLLRTHEWQSTLTAAQCARSCVLQHLLSGPFKSCPYLLHWSFISFSSPTPSIVGNFLIDQAQSCACLEGIPLPAFAVQLQVVCLVWLVLLWAPPEDAGILNTLPYYGYNWGNLQVEICLGWIADVTPHKLHSKDAHTPLAEWGWALREEVGQK